MDFYLTKEQKDIQKAAREFAKGEFTDVAREFDLNETFPAKIVEKARELGLVGLFVPFEYGGPGFGFLEQAMVLEEFWKVDPGIGQQLSSVTFGAEEFIANLTQPVADFPLDTLTGLTIDFLYTTEEGVEMAGSIIAATSEDKLYRIIFTAPAELYEFTLQWFNPMYKSFKILPAEELLVE